MPRRAARIDSNHPDIVDALLGAGCRVQSLASCGKGIPDLLVANPWGELHLLEVKDGSKPPSAQALTEDQESWHLHWDRCRRRGVLNIVRTPEEALRAVGLEVKAKP